jgi:peptidoglycan glycosyltransferase
MATAAGRARIGTIQGSPQINRVTYSGYPPGSTFKVVTTTAALGTGKYTPLTLVDGSSPITVQTKRLSNFNNEQYGKITLTKALTDSVNTAFARVAMDIGIPTIADTMDAYGFGKKPLIDYPKDQILASGVRDTNTHELIPVNSDVDIARVGIGQERLSVTPMQMALVAATIARGGEEPRLSTIRRVVDPDGRTLWSLGKGKSTGRVMSQRDAAELTAMMKQVVNDGTGTAAQLQGLSVAGKTGTAERGAVGSNIAQPWFIGFAPADNPKVAVAVTLESVVGGQGGIDAAPIAKAMMEAAL